MNRFDQYLRKNIAKEQQEVPSAVKQKIESTLQSLPEMEQSHHVLFYVPRYAMVSLCTAFVVLVLLPNISPTYAKTMEKIPVIGDIVRVVTIRNYYYVDEKHELDIKVPIIENENSEAFAPINSDIKELTDILLKQFHEDVEQLGNKGYSSIYADYNVVMNTNAWFTLKIQIIQVEASSSIQYQYYHLNKVTGEIVELKDIVKDDAFYQVVSENIQSQMLEKMEQDSNLAYFIQKDDGKQTLEISATQNFYWDENGNLVIVFDKYEVAPGYMGSPEFTIDKEVIAPYIKQEMKVFNQ